MTNMTLQGNGDGELDCEECALEVGDAAALYAEGVAIPSSCYPAAMSDSSYRCLAGVSQNNSCSFWEWHRYPATRGQSIRLPNLQPCEIRTAVMLCTSNKKLCSYERCVVKDAVYRVVFAAN